MNYRSNHIRNLVARETREQIAHENDNSMCAMERNLINTHYLKPQSRVHVPRVLAISGGKGGVGKTLFSANLAYSCAALGQRVLVIDGDLGLSNLDVVMNLRTRGSIDDVLAGECGINDVIIQYGPGLDVLPASSGFLKVAELDRVHKLILLDQVEAIETEYDLILIDTPAGVSRTVQHWAASAAEVVIVVTPEPTSLADGYATMKILKETTNENSFSLLVNMAQGPEEGLQIFDRFSNAAEEFLGVKVNYLGAVPYDSNAKLSIRHRALLCKNFPFSKASVAIGAISSHLSAKSDNATAKGTVQFFWRRMVTYGCGDATC
jgi:flagellar biosynthesis protein FlhG